MSEETRLTDGALVVVADRVPAALAALAVACDVEPDAAVSRLMELGFAVADIPGAFEPLIVHDFHGELEGPADAAVAALAPFVDDGTALEWEDDNGNRWRYLITGGSIVEQVPARVWRDVRDRAERAGGVLAQLTIKRDVEKYAQWWEQAANCEEIIESLECVHGADRGDISHALAGLMLVVFQSCTGAEEWLHVTGLRRGVSVEHLTLDIDPDYDGEGVLCGAVVVLYLFTTAPCGGSCLKVKVDTDRVRAVLAPLSVNDPLAALAETVDVALELVNRDIASRDQFTIESREIITN